MPECWWTTIKSVTKRRRVTLRCCSLLFHCSILDKNSEGDISVIGYPRAIHLVAAVYFAVVIIPRGNVPTTRMSVRFVTYVAKTPPVLVIISAATRLGTGRIPVMQTTFPLISMVLVTPFLTSHLPRLAVFALFWGSACIANTAPEIGRGRSCCVQGCCHGD